MVWRIIVDKNFICEERRMLGKLVEESAGSWRDLFLCFVLR